jgi:hypothetical protein
LNTPEAIIDLIEEVVVLPMPLLQLIVVNETGGTVKLTKASGANANQKSASSPNSPTEKNGKGQKK